MAVSASDLLKGFLIGFAVAAPVGPIGVLCIRRTLANGRRSGFLSGLGAATADMLYAAVAAFGLTVVTGLLLDQAVWIRIIGGGFLLYLGITTFKARPTAGSGSEQPGHSLLSDYLTTFLLTLTNPLTILSFVAILAGFRLTQATAVPMRAATVVAGAFLGSASWWLLLSFAVSLVRTRFSPAWMVWVNRSAGALIMLFGVLALRA
jgi:threonine/homoserine/homoserine lactone efflux protein